MYSQSCKQLHNFIIHVHTLHWYMYTHRIMILKYQTTLPNLYFSQCTPTFWKIAKSNLPYWRQCRQNISHTWLHTPDYVHTHIHTHIVHAYPNLAVCTGDHVCTNVYTHHTLYCVQTWMHTQVVHSSCLYVCYGAQKVRAQHLSGLLIKSACQRLRLVAKRGKEWGLKAGQPHLASYMVWDKGWPTRRGTIINVV